MNKFVRVVRHLCTTRWGVRRVFSQRVLDEIEAATREVEAQHAGEIRFVVEAALDAEELLRDVSPRRRAIDVFGRLGVWDTAENNGVLVYVLYADHDVEILADRGIAARVTQADWEAVCREMEQHYKSGRFAEGSVAGVRAVGRMLAKHFPGSRRGDRGNELPNQPILL